MEEKCLQFLRNCTRIHHVARKKGRRRRRKRRKKRAEKIPSLPPSRCVELREFSPRDFLAENPENREKQRGKGEAEVGAMKRTKRGLLRRNEKSAVQRYVYVAARTAFLRRDENTPSQEKRGRRKGGESKRANGNKIHLGSFPRETLSISVCVRNSRKCYGNKVSNPSRRSRANSPISAKKFN